MEETLKDMLIGAWLLIIIGLSLVLIVGEDDSEVALKSTVFVLVIVTTIGITKYFS